MFDDDDRLFVQKTVVGQIISLSAKRHNTVSNSGNKTFPYAVKTHLFVAVQVQVGRGEYVRQRPESMEQHGRELYHYDEREEEHKHQTDGLQVQVLFGDYDLCANICDYITLRVHKYSRLIDTFSVFVSQTPVQFDRSFLLLKKIFRFLFFCNIQFV